LFEYNYFEMNKFKTQNNWALTQEHSVLAFSRRVQDEDYIRFINSLKIRAITVSDHKIAGLGDLLNFSDLAG
jgi:hypothetical protein